jgi:Yip1-like protein
MDIGTRIRNMLTTPRTEWPVIAAERWEIGDLYRSWIIPMAAIPVVAQLLRSWVAGLGFFRPLLTAVASYLLTLASTWILGMIFSRVAPSFDGQQDDLAGLKLAAFGATASWVGGAFHLLPWIGWLISVILSLYSLYLLYLGAPILMRVPEIKAVPYTVAVILASIVIFFVVALVLGLLFAGPAAF